MMAQRARILGITALVLTMGAVGCKKDKPKPEEEKKAEPAAVPSGLSFNDFVPNSGDAGAEQGGAAAGGSAPTSGNPTVKVTDPGGEPRALRKYAFVPNKVEKRILTVAKEITQVGAGPQPGNAAGTTRLFVDLTPKEVQPTGTKFEVKILRVDIPGAPAQAAGMIAALSGLSATFTVSPQGELGDFSAPEGQAVQANPQLAQQILEALGQGLQLLIVALPSTPVGPGAKWEVNMSSEASQGARRYTLKSATNEGGVIESDVELAVGRRATPAPDGKGEMFVQVEGHGRYTQDLRFNEMSPKGGGDLTVNEKIEMPDKKHITQKTVIKQTIESVGGAGAVGK